MREAGGLKLTLTITPVLQANRLTKCASHPKRILKSSANMYESSGQQFFKINTGIQSVLDAFDKSKLVVTFLTNLGVTEILCSFKLVLEWKIGKEIPESSRLEFLESFLANNFALLDAEVYTSGPSNKGGITDLLAIRQKSREPSFWEVIDSFVLSAYPSLVVSRTLLE